MITRRRLLSSAALGVVGLGAAGVGCAATPEAVADGKDAHPLAGLMDFEGVVLAQDPILPILGKPATIIDFWASWCGPCRPSFRHLDQLYRTFLPRGLEMVAVSVDDDPVAAKRFWAQHRPRFPVAWDGNAVVRERFGVVSLPTTVLLDEMGSIVVRSTGFDENEHRYLEEQVRRLVQV